MASSSPTIATRWLGLGREIVRGVADLIYPPGCLLCDVALAESSASFCPSCTQELLGEPVSTCPRCAETVGPFTHVTEGCSRCRTEKFHFHAAIRLGPYQGRLRDAVLRMKDATGDDIAEAMGRLWADQAAADLEKLGVDWVIPVPLHWLRRVQRGYNQAAALARALAVKLGKPCRPRWLWRKRYTPHQTAQPPTARRQNLRGAFQAAARAELRGKAVLLVDDVLTTGSTCSEAARALRRSGVARVVVAVLARSES